MKVQIVEDDAVVLQALKFKLTKEGFTVMTHNNVADALNNINEFNPDVIITDILMPHTSGLELIGMVKSRGGKKIPIIVLSSIGEEDTIMEAFQLGADDFITKPFNPIELSIRIKKILNKKVG